MFFECRCGWLKLLHHVVGDGFEPTKTRSRLFGSRLFMSNCPRHVYTWNFMDWGRWRERERERDLLEICFLFWCLKCHIYDIYIYHISYYIIRICLYTVTVNIYVYLDIYIYICIMLKHFQHSPMQHVMMQAFWTFVKRTMFFVISSSMASEVFGAGHSVGHSVESAGASAWRIHTGRWMNRQSSYTCWCLLFGLVWQEKLKLRLYEFYTRVMFNPCPGQGNNWS